MKIKKKTSLMMLAASTAAIVGVAAVSFAAWTGSNGGTLTANAATGAVEVLGFNSTPTYSFSPLVPYDQGEVEDCVNYINIEIPAYDYNVSYTLTAEVTSNAANLDLRYSTDADVVLPNEEGFQLTDWTQFTSEVLIASNDALDGSTAPVEGAVSNIKVILVSDSEAHMDKDFTITITLEKTAATQG